MKLDTRQQYVLRGMALGAVTAVALVCVGVVWNPFGYVDDLAPSERLTAFGRSSLILAVCLAVSVGRLAKHRFFTSEDIDGGGHGPGSARATLLQALLQNTLEQAVLGALVHAAWAVTMPGSWLSVVPLAAIAFGVGRILFFAGYARGAPARALGFTLTFYPTVVMLVVLVAAALVSWP